MSAKNAMLSRPDDMSWRGPPQPTRSKFMRKAIENPLVPIGEWKHCKTMLLSVLPVLEHFEEGGIWRHFKPPPCKIFLNRFVLKPSTQFDYEENCYIFHMCT